MTRPLVATKFYVAVARAKLGHERWRGRPRRHGTRLRPPMSTSRSPGRTRHLRLGAAWLVTLAIAETVIHCVARANVPVTGVELGASSAWTPRSKPIWLTEIGCPAVDKGANQPNVFPDPKSSESFVPHFSNGARDDLIHRRYLEAVLTAFDPAFGASSLARMPPRRYQKNSLPG